jgi:hypothetical protein
MEINMIQLYTFLKLFHLASYDILLIYLKVILIKKNKKNLS